jgi:hypothetical protein
MRAAEDGNVEILERFWNFETAKDMPEVVPPILVYADLLATHDSRNADAARMIYEQRSHQHSVPQYAALIPVEMEPVEVRQPKSGQRTYESSRFGTPYGCLSINFISLILKYILTY